MIKVGVIGMGYGRQVHIPVYQRLKETTVTAISDFGSGKAHEVAAAQTYPVTVYSDGFQLIASEDVDLISIATPPEFHFDLICASLEAQKNVICEKPFTVSLEQAERLAKIHQNNSAKLCVGYEFPYDAAFIEIKDQVKKGAIGEVQRFKVEWLTSSATKAATEKSWKTSGEVGTGLLYDWCCHIFDYSTQILTSPIKWIMCKRHSKHEIDILCQFENATVGHFVVANNYHTDLGHKLTLLGTEGSLSLAHVPPYGWADKTLEWTTVSNRKHVELPVLHSFEKEYPDNRMAAFETLVDQFINPVSASTYPGIDRALSVWKVLTAAEKSIEENSPVVVV